KYNFAENLPAIEGDATQIRQVIMNLITNASEAIGQASGIISITTGAMQIDRRYLREVYLDENLPEGLYVTLEVADTGCGMEAETRARLFDPFFTTKFAGRGLGMAAVLGIVRGHHGAIKVYSEPGQGTTMKVLLPAVAAETAAAAKQADADGSWRSSATVLLVDDEETVRAIGKMMLEHLGLTVITASDGCQAVDIFRERGDSIDCVILDLTMPHMDGEGAFRELRRIRKDIRVIMSSGYNQQDVTQRFVGKGIAGFIQKPYELKALAHTLQSILGR
ncbi:MAG: response regulator, partial [Anaerolineaceae bacterium]|nr:response regulator [Anaerolineaceae bacterium]